MTVGSGAFTEETATRSASVAVVGDGDAYLTLEFPQHVSFDCSTEVAVEIRNRTGQPLDTLTVEFALDSGSVESLSVDGPGTYIKPSDSKVSLDSGTLKPGEETTLTVGLNGFTGQGTAELMFNVDASGDSVGIKTTSERVIDLDYECSEEEGEDGDDGDDDEDEGDNDEGEDNNGGNDDGDDDEDGGSDDGDGDGDSED